MEASDNPKDGVEIDIKSKKKADKLLTKKKIVKPDKTKKVNIISRKQIILRYVNKLLDTIDNKTPIDNLLSFSNINRRDIITPAAVKIYKDMTPEIYKLFDKMKCGYYHRKSPNISLNCLRGMCKESGLILERMKKDVTNNDGFRRTEYFYKIKDNKS
jgi:hypothetical protein